MDKELFFTPAEAAQFKGVSRSAVYGAIKTGRLPHIQVLNRIALKQEDVKAWEPIKYAGRPGIKGGRPKGKPMSEEAKKRISEGQVRRWERVKKKPQIDN